jgi:hypothetical protein
VHSENATQHMHKVMLSDIIAVYSKLSLLVPKHLLTIIQLFLHIIYRGDYFILIMIYNDPTGSQSDGDEARILMLNAGDSTKAIVLFFKADRISPVSCVQMFLFISIEVDSKTDSLTRAVIACHCGSLMIL